MNKSRQFQSRLNPYQQPPQIIQFEDNPSSIYYDYAPPSMKAEINNQLHSSYYSNYNPHGQSALRSTRKYSGHQYNSNLSINLEQPPGYDGYSSMSRSRKYTDDGTSSKGSKTPRASNSGFNMSKFLSNYKEKVEGTSSRKNSSNEKNNDEDRYGNLQISNFKKLQFQEQTLIAQLPEISKISFQFLDNWGDPNYIGAKAIQFFTEDGRLIQPTAIIPQVPSAYNLINGNVFTKCDHEFWLSGLSKNISINFIFDRRFTLSMIRIWNYNKANYTKRGIRNIRILGDNSIIFFGEIRKAEGKLTTYASTAQYILFTNSNPILNRISKYDWLSNYSFDHLLQIQDHSTPDKEPAIIYPLQNLYNCYALIVVEIIQNYGDPHYTAYQKLRFYNNSGNLIKYKNKSNKDKVMTNPPAPIQFNIIEPSIVQKIVVKNSQNEAAIKKLRITFDTGLIYIIELGYSPVDQIFLLNSSIKYDFYCLEVKNTPLENTVRFGKQVKIILHKNYGGNAISFNKLEIFDVFNTPMLNSRQVPYYVSQNMRYLETTTFSNWKHPQNDHFNVPFSEEKPIEIVIKFQSVIVFGAVILWNTKGKRQDSVKEMEIRIDDKVTYHGYLDHYEEGGKPHTVLLSFKEQIYNHFKDYLGERKGKQIVGYNNEGMLFFSEK